MEKITTTDAAVILDGDARLYPGLNNVENPAREGQEGAGIQPRSVRIRDPDLVGCCSTLP